MKHIFVFLFLTITFCFTAIYPASARIDMLPYRVVMEERERSSTVTILNLSNETRQFRLQLLNYLQNEDGTYTNLDAPLNENFDPQEIVRMSPKEFTLGPEGQQAVRILLRKPADLPEGEYRFHFLATSYATDEERNPSNEDVMVAMAMNIGIAIPVVVRHGDLSVETKLQDFNLVGPTKTNTGKPQFEFTATREGDASSIGEVIVEWAEDGSTYKEIGKLTNFNIFTEITQRRGAVNLNALPTQGTLRVTYRNDITKEIYDEIIFDL